MTETLVRPDTQAPGWVLCDACRGLLWEKRFERMLRVCEHCGKHARLPAAERMRQLLDPDSVTALNFGVPSGDPLSFTDSKPYPKRLAEARARTGLDEAVVCARGTIDGAAVVIAVMDFGFLGGSLGAAVGEMITQAADEALATRTPLLIVTASGGARMQEGAVALMQMAKTSAALGQLDDAGVLTISLITDPTYGGVAASFATLCDVLIAEPGARLGFAGPRVIEQTIKQKLGPRFQTAEFLLERGLIDMVRPRASLRATLSRLLAAGAPAARRLEGLRPLQADGVLVRDPDELADRDPWEVVKLARDLSRPTTLDYLALMTQDFEELRGDRAGNDCPAIVGGIGRLNGRWAVLIGHQKGRNVEELTARNFGMPTPSGYRKAGRLMRLAAKLGLPVITLIDTPGAYPGPEAEEQGQAVAIAENLRRMAGLGVPTVAVIIGEGGSGGALGLAVADQVYICSNGIYSVISPEGCAAILWKDAKAAPRAAAALRLDPRHLLQLGVVDGVVTEPPGGTGQDHVEAAQRVEAVVSAALADLSVLTPAELIARRRTAFRRYTVDGPAVEQPMAARAGSERR
ncbi:MAG TPA: acetyl-CoA carboxylase carboxyl transferase subunit alpha [Streptosporangiaceae bacterium]|nr:acetyl-CoA carboxylase carboxyl transferase subunit alpha [Streptosporangiaceae bacterium]